MEIAHIRTPLGIARITGDENGVSGISIVDSNNETSDEIPTCLTHATAELSEYFAGKRRDFTFKMNPSGTHFQQSVWQELLRIPFGSTVSYMDLAKRLGDAKAIRAVASANAKNPLWVAVPCHRVIGANGALTGYAGGLWRKKWLIEHETPPVQQLLF
ncbi:MAG: methylated-DNA--[protein]-cysteine S-methyltransferase [Proteobacteria bacterium]|nr:MAG: methylated-DNA--[protein]-cysteine S-methyltransferase [Pseudomonadota bacterium]